MVVFNKSLIELKIQKKRTSFRCVNQKIRFGDYAFISTNESKMELIHLTNLKKLLKKLIKKKKKKKKDKNNVAIKNYKTWLYLLPNYILSKKSKNSRMGKGKGSFLRWVFRIKKGFIVAEFLGISKYRLNLVLIKINKKFKLKLSLVTNLKINTHTPLWSKLNLSIELFNKYRIM